jgi:F0F1-type ATP synthase membrane subunit c/vacuolar-type H+-ATPase subunit K
VTNQPQPSDAQRLLTLRIIWAALLMGQVMYLVVATTFAASPAPSNGTRGDLPQLLFYLAAAMLVTSIPIAYALRAIVYRRGRQPDGSVAPAEYATGNILFWAMMEADGMFAITGALLNGGRGPHLYVAAVAMAVQILNFPTGWPLRGDRLN